MLKVLIVLTALCLQFKVVPSDALRPVAQLRRCVLATVTAAGLFVAYEPTNIKPASAAGLANYVGKITLMFQRLYLYSISMVISDH